MEYVHRYPAAGSPKFTERDIIGKNMSVSTTANSRKNGDHLVPNIDIFETKEEKVIYVDLPGVNKSDVKITFDKGILTLEGEKKLSARNKQLITERKFGTFKRNFKVTFPVKENKISAKFHNGVLSIKLPKAEEAKSKYIAVG